ncbi:unnamed protein product [Calicophoron daubneyi]|uniref:Uncharacterized protein n=1 Tax=Calicophoron daubneyi TaxID=300641 RepID=A0AAV2U0Y7_CALDB
MSDAQGAYYPLAVLIEELRNEDVQLRLNSIRQLKTIALALGAEKTRSQLIPFLNETIYDEDEVLFALAEQFGSLVPYVGGAEYADSLLPPLESLASVEEVTVRDKAVESMRKLAPEFTQTAMEESFYPLVRRLATGDWFTGRTSACALVSVIYPRVSKSKRSELLELLQKLAADETPMVRRAVAGRLGELALAMSGGPRAETSVEGTSNPKIQIQHSSGDSTPPGSTDKVSEAVHNIPPPTSQTTESEGKAGTHGTELRQTGDNIIPSASGTTRSSNIHGNVDGAADNALDPALEVNNILAVILPMFSRLVVDEQESVRLMAVESIVGLIHAIGPAEAETHLVEQIQNMLIDKAWRVRCMVAEKFIDIFMAIRPNAARSRLVPVFIDLLHDDEAEVRAVAAGKVKAFARCLLGLPPTDPNAPPPPPIDESSSLSPEASDEDLKMPEVQLPKPHIDTDVNMEEVWATAASDEAIVSSLLPAIKTLTTDSNTHVRSALASAILGLAPLIGNTLTVEHLLPVLLAYLKDDSPEVRFNLISNLEHVNCVIGLDHLSGTLLPAVIQLAEDPKWRVRLVIIEYMPMLADQLGIDVFNSKLTKLCLDWLVDEVYAVREAAVENLVRLGTKFGNEWVSDIFVPKVAQLAVDTNYLHRMICLQCVISLSEIVNPSVCKEHLLPTTLAMQTDNVPNVRFKRVTKTK